MKDLDEKKTYIFGKILAVVLVIYAFGVTYISGSLVSVPNVHTYVLVPISAFAAFCLIYYLRDGMRLTTGIIPILIYGLYVSVRYFMEGTQNMPAIWLCMIIVILISGEVELHKVFPFKLVLILGYLQFAGMLVQILFPGFYYENLAVMFVGNENIVEWSEHYGFSGFMFQVGFASLSLIFAEGYCISEAFNCYENRKKRIVFLLQAILFIIAICLTGKRGTFAIAMIIPILILIIDKRTRKAGILILVSGLLIVSISIFLLYRFNSLLEGKYLVGRLSDTVVEILNGQDFSSERFFLWSKALEIFNEHPLFGTGMHTYWFYSGTGMDPHNTYLETLSEQGIIGFTLLLVSIIWCFVSSIQLKNKDSRTVSSAVSFALFIQLEQILDSFVENSMTTNIIELIMYLFAIAILNSATVSQYSERSSGVITVLKR